MAKLVEQNVVVLGSLNPAIIHPNWLVTIGLIPLNEKIEIKCSIGGNIPSEFSWGIYRWQVNYEMLKVIVRPEESPNNLNTFIEKIFSQLRHTPVKAIGHNFNFKIAHEKIEKLSFLDKNWELGGNLGWGIVVDLRQEINFSTNDMTKVKINISKNTDCILVNLNFHCDIDSVNQLIIFSKKCEENFETAKKILKEICKW